VAIEAAWVNVFPSSRLEKYFGYEVRFRLKETAGTSGATIQDVFVVHSDGGGDHTGPSCWRDILRVPPGGTLDVFYTDEGLKWLGYCAPLSGGPTDKPELQVWVSFADDRGQSGTVRAVATAQ
jgi:hypothetical protein